LPEQFKPDKQQFKLLLAENSQTWEQAWQNTTKAKNIALKNKL